ncbi:MAG: NifB/NifX family molybdenum-iron cluster-binding protein [Pirellulales bacterium]|nr:NifB/NifX family molybdenum-iron cluster-binding protein [Pirellulales bacterium]
MTIAIATFDTRVSPRFDCAQSILIVTVNEDGTSTRREVPAQGWAPYDRINRLLELGVDTVICGGIDRWSATSLQFAGVTVYGWVTGEVEDALAALLRGDLDAEATVGERGRCRCRRFPGDEAGVTRRFGPGGSGQGCGGYGWKHGGGRRGGPGGPRNS